MKKLYFIVNVAARNGKSMFIWNRLLHILEKEKVVYEVYYTKYHGHAIEIAEMIAGEKKDVASIIAVGGDGTIHEVVNGALMHMDKPIKVGFIGAGSGNDFARGYHLPKNPEAALKFILENRDCSFSNYDIGKYTLLNQQPKFFISSLGIGFDAEVSKIANQSNLKKFLNKLRLGFLTYALILIKVLFTYKTKKVQISIDGNTEIYDKVWFITISNQPFYGGGMKISPSALPNDGILNITIVHQLSRLKLLSVFLSVFWGGHRNFSEVKMLTGKQIEIKSEEDMLVHADGELVGNLPIKIHICKQQVCYISRVREMI